MAKATSKVKPKKAAPKKSKPDATGTNTIIEDILGSLNRGTSCLQTCIERLSKEIDSSKDYNDKRVSHLAWVSKQLAGLLGEVRKLEVHEAKVIKHLSPEMQLKLIKGWFSDQTLKTQRAVVEFAKSEMAGESVL